MCYRTNNGRPQEFLQEGAKSTSSFSSPSLPLPFFSSPPLLSCPVHSALSSLVRSGSLIYSHGSGERYKLPRWGQGQSPGRNRNLGILSRRSVSCDHNFGSFCENQNVVIEANLSLYIFQGMASAALAHTCGRPWYQ